MPIDITMPRLSDTMESGTIINWNAQEGDEVSAGDAVADIETDKATMEMQVFDDGTLAKILVDAGETVDVGTVIAVLAEEGEDVDEVREQASNSGGASSSTESETEKKQETSKSKSQDEKDGDEGGGTTTETKAGSEKAERKEQRSASRRSSKASANGEASRGGEGGSGQRDGGRLFISPVARRMADEHGLDISKIDGSGPNGRIIKRDIQEAIERGGDEEAAGEGASVPTMSAPGGGRLEPGDRSLSNMRQTIAKRLVEAKQTIPHYQVTYAFNMDPMLELRKTLNTQLEAQGVKLSVNDFLVRACALSIHAHPEFNAVWGGDKITVKPNVNVGVAIALPRERGGGLVVATIRNADRKGLRQISDETRQLAEKARSKGLTLDEMADSTFTLSNLGMYGVEHFTAIINPPNAAILAVGASIKKPVVREDAIVIGHEMQATLSLDHRIIDGAMAAEYLQTLRQMIENPATLLV